jgi:hypothetical protein
VIPFEGFAVCGYVSPVTKRRVSSHAVCLDFRVRPRTVEPYWLGPPSTPFVPVN